MASPTAKLTFRLLLAAAVVLILFYVGRPLYWKISATVHDIRHNKQTVSGGISQIVQEAQRSVGWFHDESDSGLSENKKSASARFLLRQRIKRFDDSNPRSLVRGSGALILLGVKFMVIPFNVFRNKGQHPV